MYLSIPELMLGNVNYSNGPLFGPGNRDRSILFRVCQLGVLLFRLITPFSYLYVIAAATFFTNPNCKINTHVLDLVDILDICHRNNSFSFAVASR